MKPEEINKIIAEYCVWKIRQSTAWELRDEPPSIREVFYNDEKVIKALDYYNNLNAIHEAEKKLMQDYNLIANYRNAIYKESIDECQKRGGFNHCFDSSLWHATSQQRSKAFVKTIGKWKEQ